MTAGDEGRRCRQAERRTFARRSEEKQNEQRKNSTAHLNHPIVSRGVTSRPRKRHRAAPEVRPVELTESSIT